MIAKLGVWTVFDLYSRSMTKLWRAQAHDDDPSIGGVIVQWPSGHTSSAAWRSGAPIPDTLAAAKEYATALVQQALDQRRIDDVERTNTPSLVAAIQKHISDWNDQLKAAIYARGPQPDDASPLQ